ncbi:unnamed protein product [Cylicocyclus nassatus]|uniref:Uncharacterized protein n=1 Tax=Cylicocyclus nassatus TaxID=53992 RepID=A0AA36HE86_CYLNA|nr:unnamed protein product [Cylicocyclus nassatus]
MLYSKLFIIFFLVCVIAKSGSPRPFEGGFNKRMYKGPDTPYRGGPIECYDLCYWNTYERLWQLMRGTRRRIQQECNLCELMYRLEFEYNAAGSNQNATIAPDPKRSFFKKRTKDRNSAKLDGGFNNHTYMEPKTPYIGVPEEVNQRKPFVT